MSLWVAGSTPALGTRIGIEILYGRVVKLVDTLALGANARKRLGVRVSPRPQQNYCFGSGREQKKLLSDVDKFRDREICLHRVL